MDIPGIDEARRVTLRPGDVLAIRTDHLMDDAEVDDFIRRLHEVFGGKVPVVILNPGSEIGIISAFQPDGALCRR